MSRVPWRGWILSLRLWMSVWHGLLGRVICWSTAQVEKMSSMSILQCDLYLRMDLTVLIRPWQHPCQWSDMQHRLCLPRPSRSLSGHLLWAIKHSVRLRWCDWESCLYYHGLWLHMWLLLQWLRQQRLPLGSVPMWAGWQCWLLSSFQLNTYGLIPRCDEGLLVMRHLLSHSWSVQHGGIGWVWARSHCQIRPSVVERSRTELLTHNVAE